MAGRGLRGGRATILDVARAAGVSRQTVSNALNHPTRVSPDTLDRVTREIHRLGFRPNATAQQLRRRRASAYGFEVNPAGIARMGHILDEFLVELTGWAPSHASHLVTFSAPSDDVLSAYQHMLAPGWWTASSSPTRALATRARPGSWSRASPSSPSDASGTCPR